ncbi:fimbrial protein [Providencia alcalifaciens]|uniref:fimbrial protein n=1 Tax=Providencia alcalifaciens TaxID=126385 RepID=UPI00045383CC|nr:fimbrial protein [Providencia alcalifaciens]EUD08986.1 fimbrial protein [Providencia alcalifaciens R90-1475]
MIFKRFFLLISLAVLIPIAKNVNAKNITVTINGEIFASPCIVDNNQTIDVKFGPVSISELMSEKTQVQKSVSLDCQSYSGSPYVKITGTSLSSSLPHVLRTNTNNLGIALFQGKGTNYPMRIGSGTNKNGFLIQNGLMGNTFTFTAMPYSKDTTTLYGGDFNASATMSIIYI